MILRHGSARTALVLTAVTLLVLLALVLLVVRGGRGFTQADAEAVKAVLLEQQAAWNQGELEAFMAGYHRSPDMTFFAGGEPRRGWDDALARYRDRYQGKGKEMGQLTFSDLQVEGAGPDHAWVRGTWEHQDADPRLTQKDA